jgi:hypothetical protein
VGDAEEACPYGSLDDFITDVTPDLRERVKWLPEAAWPQRLRHKVPIMNYTVKTKCGANIQVHLKKKDFWAMLPGSPSASKGVNGTVTWNCFGSVSDAWTFVVQKYHNRLDLD